MAEKQRPESQHPLSEAKKWAFGGGSMISTMTNSINNTFYYYFLTNVVGMSAALMGLVTTLSRAVGLIYGPISGAIMQRKEWKYGKYRTWLMFFYPASIVFLRHGLCQCAGKSLGSVGLLLRRLHHCHALRRLRGKKHSSPLRPR